MRSSVEVKALDGLGPVEQAQVMNYLKGANLHRAVLLELWDDQRSIPPDRATTAEGPRSSSD